jgi:hypothetical protein
MAAKKAVPFKTAQETEPVVDRSAEFHGEATSKGKIEIRFMSEDHPDNPVHHVKALKDATEAGVFDYR